MWPLPRNFPDADICPLIAVCEVLFTGHAIVHQATYSGGCVTQENYTVFSSSASLMILPNSPCCQALLFVSPERSAVPHMWQGFWKHLQTCPLVGEGWENPAQVSVKRTTVFTERVLFFCVVKSSTIFASLFLHAAPLKDHQSLMHTDEKTGA